jgi:Protein of unknown function (DUF3084)
MFWTILALILWVTLGGFISYYGDLQGRRWGKRRVSWFGLRPKHTAILITSVTGGVISLMSVVGVLLVARPVRDVVMRGEQAIHDNKRLIDQQKQQQLFYNSEIERYKAQRDQTHQLVIAGDKELSKLKTQLQTTETHLQALLSKMEGMQRTVRGLHQATDRLRLEKSRLSNEYHTLDKQNQNAATLNTDLARQNEEYSNENLALTRQKKSLEEANAALKQAKTNMEHVVSRFQTSADDFYKQNLALDKIKDQLEKDIADMRRDRDEALNLIRQRERITAEIQSLNQLYAQKYAVLRQGRVCLRAGVELSRQLIGARLRPEAVRNEVEMVINNASERAKGYGSEPEHGGRVARLLTQKKITISGYEDLDESLQVEEIVNQWAGQDISCVVVATTVTNCLAGEPAFIELKTYPVVRVYAKGAVVASRLIDGHQSVDHILEELLSFLHKDVKDAALQAGTIPRIDPDTGSNEVGIIGTAELFRLTERVRKMHGPVLLSARAKTDLSSADSLNLTFSVTRAPASAARAGN